MRCCKRHQSRQDDVLSAVVLRLRDDRAHPSVGRRLCLRRKVRTERRPGMPIENALTFYPKYAAELLNKHVRLAWLIWRMARVRQTIKRDPRARLYGSGPDTHRRRPTGNVGNVPAIRCTDSSG
jgi:hypothetical protein